MIYSKRMTSQLHKQCKICAKLLHESEFYKLSYSKDGKDYRCKFCRKSSSKKWKQQNKSHISDYDRDWRAKNSDVKLSTNSRYRARKLNSYLEKFSESDVLLTYGTSCHICGCAIDLNAPRQTGKAGWQNGLHIDHLVPLSKGGEHSLENVRPSHGLCNLIKHTSLV